MIIIKNNDIKIDNKLIKLFIMNNKLKIIKNDNIKIYNNWIKYIIDNKI